MCVARSTAAGRSRRAATGPGADWWTHISDVGLHPYGNYSSSFEVTDSPTVPAQVTACSVACGANASCFGWTLIKVTPDSGRTVPECCLYTRDDISAPWYRPDHNMECG
eukprot:CAMPEP_0182946672 /NCGR_PEP_ID=MMETSP0105_2-20130417/57395_1 /TAXON_ID=81532 ORGANISM="Acanthoeca-like sp., Strain 10tr" /NCGR_SAMPLE_ID=MMETSP0105_2 /ASSEMBLY_ACC=CAM_ASM_000205 /LENGTH=108 /DNA_ID=CAMNT_0025086819 /DNA_START=1 /DNA_END=324 /DNA_ORIENTATION=-